MSVSLINGHIDPDDKPKADCSKCVTKCRYRDWFEHEVRVGEIGCNVFKPIENTNEEGER